MAAALDRLRKLHVSSVSAELLRVHPTWLIRALQEESPAVQRMVAASLTGPLRHSIQAGLLLDEQDIASERPVNPIVRDWVMGLWTERLVGGEPVRSDDPPALFAVYGLSLSAGLRLCRMAGLCKMVIASEGSATGLLGPLNRQRSEWLKDSLRGIEQEFEELRPSRPSIDRAFHAAHGATMPGDSGCSPSRGCSPTPSRSGCGGRCNTGHTRS